MIIVNFDEKEIEYRVRREGKGREGDGRTKKEYVYHVSPE